MGLTARRLLGAGAAIVITWACLRLLLTAEVRVALGLAIRRAAWVPLLAAFIINPVVQYLRAWRFGLFVERRESPPSGRLFRVATLLVFFNYLLPFRAGEASFPVLLRREYGTGLATGFGFLALTRLLDLFAVVVAGGLAGMLLFRADPALMRLCGFALATGLLLLGITWPLARISETRAMGALGRWPRAAALAGRVLEGLHLLGDVRRYGVFLGLTAMIWLAQFLVCFLVLRSTVEGAGLLHAVTGGSAAMLSFALPVNGVAGTGPMEAAWAWALSRGGIPWAEAVASGLVLHAVFVAGAVVMAALVVAVRPAADRGPITQPGQ